MGKSRHIEPSNESVLNFCIGWFSRSKFIKIAMGNLHWFALAIYCMQNKVHRKFHEKPCVIQYVCNFA